MPKAAKAKSRSSTANRVKAPAAANPSSIPTSDGEYRFDFGMHKGKTLSDRSVPWGYVRWCISTGIAAQREDLSRAIKQSQRRRPSSTTSYQTSIERRMQAVKRKIPTWLYDACDDAFHEAYAFFEGPSLPREKVEALEDVAKSLVPLYPPQPSSTDILPHSESVRDLRAVLSLLPEGAWESKELRNSGVPDKTHSVFFRTDGFTGDEYMLLTSRRDKELRYSLRMVERKHGGKVGAFAKWEVYQKLRKCIGGVMYNTESGVEHRFFDPALDWFEERPGPKFF